MSVSRRGLFGLLAVAPIAAVKAAKAATESQVIVRPGLSPLVSNIVEYGQRFSVDPPMMDLNDCDPVALEEYRLSVWRMNAWLLGDDTITRPLESS